jgi:hypothetical protein
MATTRRPDRHVRRRRDGALDATSGLAATISAKPNPLAKAKLGDRLRPQRATGGAPAGQSGKYHVAWRHLGIDQRCRSSAAISI